MKRICILDGAIGIHLPKYWALYCNPRAWDGVTGEDVAILESGPDHEDYWEVWDGVLQNASSTDRWGDVWYLDQDQDLFMTKGR